MTEQTTIEPTSPWPACANCHAETDETSTKDSAGQPTPSTNTRIDSNDGWEQLHASSDPGPRAIDILRESLKDYARAKAQAYAEETTPHQEHDEH